MPAAKLRPVSPSTTTTPPVMYSQPWSPTPSTTRDGAGVAHREALAGDALEIGLAGDGAVEHGVADDDVLGRLALGLLRLAHDDAAARQALADIVVGVARQLERHAARQEGAEALAGGAGQRERDRVLGRPAWP